MPPPAIAFDVTPLQNSHRYRGIGAYVRGLAHRLAEQDARDRERLLHERGDVGHRALLDRGDLAPLVADPAGDAGYMDSGDIVAGTPKVFAQLLEALK